MPVDMSKANDVGVFSAIMADFFNLKAMQEAPDAEAVTRKDGERIRLQNGQTIRMIQERLSAFHANTPELFLLAKEVYDLIIGEFNNGFEGEHDG